MGGEVIVEEVLLVAVPRRHLESALDVQAREGRVALPCLGGGDLERAGVGMPAYVVAYGEGRVAPAATWRGRFLRWVRAEQDGSHPDAPGLVPRSVLADVAAWLDFGHETPSEEPEDPGPAVFLEVEELGPLSKDEWVFTNELVAKQSRGSRHYMPRRPVLVHLPG